MEIYVILGSVISGIGKGIVTANTGVALSKHGKVNIKKFDSYFNLSADTISNHDDKGHGESWVTPDGLVCDLDIGQYYRYVSSFNPNSNCCITNGRVISELIERQKSGFFTNGETIQICHITDIICDFLLRDTAEEKTDYLVLEVGGTIGDSELQWIQYSLKKLKGKGFTIKTILVSPLMSFSHLQNQLKTKPVQHGISELNAQGFNCDCLVLRTKEPCSDETTEAIKDKLQNLTGTNKDDIYFLPDVEKLEDSFLVLADQNFLDKPEGLWEIKIPTLNAKKKVGLIVKYNARDSYLSIEQALVHAGYKLNIEVEVKYINVLRNSQAEIERQIEQCESIIIPGGFGSQGIEKMVKAITFTKSKGLPLFGICLGAQLIVIEEARSQGFNGANSTEFNPNTKHPVIDLMDDQDGRIVAQTMRLGLLPFLDTSTGETKQGVHRHRYHVSRLGKKVIEDSQLRVTGVSSCENKFIECISNSDGSMVGVQFHPEYLSTFFEPSEWFIEFLKK